MTSTLAHCQGCDQDQPDVRAFAVKFIENPVPETVDYCGGCAELAEMNWSGNIESIQPAAA